MIGGDMVVHYGGSIRYFLDAVIKHHDQKRLWRKGFILPEEEPIIWGGA